MILGRFGLSLILLELLWVVVGGCGWLQVTEDFFSNRYGFWSLWINMDIYWIVVSHCGLLWAVPCFSK